MLRLPFVLILNILGIVRWALAHVLYAATSLFRGKKRRYVQLDLHGGYPIGHPRGIVRRLKSEATFLELRRDIKTLGEDPSVAGVIFSPGRTGLGAARAGEVAELLDTLRERGKHLVARSDMLLTRGYLEASAADDILMSPAGRMYTFGPRFEEMFFAEAFDRHGIGAQFIHIGAFKTAANRFVQSGMTVPHRLMMEGIRTGLESVWTERVASRRRLSAEGARRLFTIAPADPRTAMEGGLLDGEAFEQDMDRWLHDRDDHVQSARDKPRDLDVQLVTHEAWRGSRPAPLNWRPLFRAPAHIAVMDLSGMIVMPGMQFPSGQSVINPDEVIPILRRLGRSRSVAGVILHINSPGGSALASDLLWKAIDDLRREKPVVAYCTDVAGSGGYYIAAAADRILCRPESIMGAIGVIMGKFNVGEAFNNIGVNYEAAEGETGGEFLSLTSPMAGRLLDNARADARGFYRRFLQRVGQARGLSKRRMHRYARGRIYLGNEALQRELVDEVSDFNGAVRQTVALCAEHGVELSDDPKLEFVPHRTLTFRDALTRSAVVATAPVSAAIEPLEIAAMLHRDALLALTTVRLKSEP